MKAKIYTIPNCVYCIKAKEILKNKGVEFEEIDITKSMDAVNFVLEKSNGLLAVPLICIDDKKCFVGINDNLDI